MRKTWERKVTKALGAFFFSAKLLCKMLRGGGRGRFRPLILLGLKDIKDFLSINWTWTLHIMLIEWYNMTLNHPFEYFLNWNRKTERHLLLAFYLIYCTPWRLLDPEAARLHRLKWSQHPSLHCLTLLWYCTRILGARRSWCRTSTLHFCPVARKKLQKQCRFPMSTGKADWRHLFLRRWWSV